MLRDMPQMPEGFTENLVDGEASASDSEAAGSWESRATTESEIREAQRIYELRSLQKDQHYKGTLQKSLLQSHTSRGKCW